VPFILKDLGIETVQLMTNNPMKVGWQSATAASVHSSVHPFKDICFTAALNNAGHLPPPYMHEYLDLAITLSFIFFSAAAGQAAHGARRHCHLHKARDCKVESLQRGVPQNKGEEGNQGIRYALAAPASKYFLAEPALSSIPLYSLFFSRTKTSLGRLAPSMLSHPLSLFSLTQGGF
jgi:hypothetical protein